MQKISKQLTTFIDHRRKGESLWLKKLKKNIGNKIKKKEILGSLKLKFGGLFLKKKRHRQQEKRVSLIYWERVTSLVSGMYLRVPVETWKVDLNWTCLFYSHGNGTVRLRIGLISGLLFRTTRILGLFWTSSPFQRYELSKSWKS